MPKSGGCVTARYVGSRPSSDGPASRVLVYEIVGADPATRDGFIEAMNAIARRERS